VNGVNLGRVLAHLFPEADPSRDYVVRLGADGEPYLAEWNLPTPEPAAAEIEAATLDAAKASKRSELKQAFRAQYEPAFEGGFLEVDYIVDRLRRGLAVPQPERDRLQAVGAGIDKLRTLFAQVNAATTVAEVEAIEWTP
jgi:XkdW protein